MERDALSGESTPTSPAARRSAASTSAVSAFSENKDLAFEAIKCLVEPENQITAATLGGLPPSNEAVYETKDIEKAYPGFSDLIKESIDNAAPRPMTPAYTDLSLAIQRALHPPGDIDPDDVATDLRRAASKRRAGRQAGGAPLDGARRRDQDQRPRRRSERRLGWMLCAPAVVAMLLVTAYPIGYAIVLSLQEIDLRFPDEGGFVGLDNYAVGADLRAVVAGRLQHPVRDGDLGRDRADARDDRSRWSCTGRSSAAGVVRTSVLIPYGIITVVAAFSWQFAFDPDTGFVNHLPFIADDKAWFGEPLQLARGDHHGRGLEDDAVHGAAAAGRAGDDRRHALRGGEGRRRVSAWQRFWKITLPLMKPAILVALLFRTLDAFRIFDSIFIMTGGAQDTESVSILGYNQLIERLNLGLGSAVSVLIFICVLIIAFIFVKGFGVRMAEGRPGS